MEILEQESKMIETELLRSDLAVNMTGVKII